MDARWPTPGHGCTALLCTVGMSYDMAAPVRYSLVGRGATVRTSHMAHAHRTDVPVPRPFPLPRRRPSARPQCTALACTPSRARTAVRTAAFGAACMLTDLLRLASAQGWPGARGGSTAAPERGRPRACPYEHPLPRWRRRRRPRASSRAPISAPRPQLPPP